MLGHWRLQDHSDDLQFASHAAGLRCVGGLDRRLWCHLRTHLGVGCQQHVVAQRGSAHFAKRSYADTKADQVQAAWASMQPRYGVPADADPLEGWIVSAVPV